VDRLARIFASQPVQHWLDVLADAGIPAGAINTVPQILADPHVAARRDEDPRQHLDRRRLAGAVRPEQPDAGPLGDVEVEAGPGGRFVPGKDDPRVAGPGTNILHPLKRVEHIVALKPDIATLDLNTMWSGTAAVINTPDNVTIMANAIQEAGSKPELEVFDSGDIQLAHALLGNGVLKRPPLFQIVMGVRYGFGSTPQTLMYAQSLLPPDAQWAAFAIGRWEFPMLAAAWFLGGHVRVGMEDNVYISKGTLTPSNAALCEKAVRILDDLGAELATAKEARAILALRS